MRKQEGVFAFAGGVKPRERSALTWCQDVSHQVKHSILTAAIFSCEILAQQIRVYNVGICQVCCRFRHGNDNQRAADGAKIRSAIWFAKSTDRILIIRITCCNRSAVKEAPCGRIKVFDYR